MKRGLRGMGIGLALAIVAFLGLLVAIRLVPSDPAAWDVDVASVEKPATPNAWLVRDGADAPALMLAVPPDQAMARVMAIAAATPRTEVLTADTARVTFITRSALMAWPDYTTVAVDAAPGGSRITLFARSRFGYSDMGVNRARAEAWAAALTSPAPTSPALTSP